VLAKYHICLLIFTSWATLEEIFFPALPLFSSDSA
jgi:hypothetical protein